jgi:hypothetical protein
LFLVKNKIKEKMYTYRLHFIDLSYQERRIITLDRFDEATNTGIRIRASEEEFSHHRGHDLFIDYIVADIETIKNIPATIDAECYYSEGVLSSSRAGLPTYKLYSAVFDLVVYTYPPYPEIIRTIFVGDIVTQRGGLSGLYKNITITDLREEQKQIIDKIIDDATKIYENKTSFSPNTTIHNIYIKKKEDQKGDQK